MRRKNAKRRKEIVLREKEINRLFARIHFFSFAFLLFTCSINISLLHVNRARRDAFCCLYYCNIRHFYVFWCSFLPILLYLAYFIECRISVSSHSRNLVHWLLLRRILHDNRKLRIRSNGFASSRFLLPILREFIIEQQIDSTTTTIFYSANCDWVSSLMVPCSSLLHVSKRLIYRFICWKRSPRPRTNKHLPQHHSYHTFKCWTYAEALLSSGTHSWSLND